MGTAKTPTEKIEELDRKIKQIQAQKRAILQKERAEERKARTKRLIQIGAEVEAACGVITDLDAFRKYVAKYAGAIKRTQLQQPQTPAFARRDPSAVQQPDEAEADEAAESSFAP